MRRNLMQRNRKKWDERISSPEEVLRNYELAETRFWMALVARVEANRAKEKLE